MFMICNRVPFVLNVQYELISSEAEQSLQTSAVVFQNKAHFGKPVTEKPKTVILEMFFCQISSICLQSIGCIGIFVPFKN